MSYIIVVRNPMNDKLIPLLDKNDDLREWDDYDVAFKDSLDMPIVQAWGCQFLEVTS